jgi:hypothetical protein
MVATDVASRGIGMIANPPEPLTRFPTLNILMRDLLDALLRSSRALATLVPMTSSRALRFSILITRAPWACR